jgi:hypothetical protein
MNRMWAFALVLLGLGALFFLSWYGPPRGSRRIQSGFLERLALEPIVQGAMAAAGGGTPAAPAGGAGGAWTSDSDSADAHHAISGGRTTTRFWRRRFDTLAFTATAELDTAGARVFLSAVRDSLERRLESAGATLRDVDDGAWVTSAGRAMTDPLALEVPYATRRRVGWVSVRALHDRDRTLTMWVTVHEGPKPSG